MVHAMNSSDYNVLLPEIEQRVSEVLSRMTLTEKIGQLWQIPPVEFDGLQGDEVRWRERPGLAELIRAGRVGSLLNLADPVKVNEYQRLAVQGSRLGIPLIVGSDVIHGFRTIFPIPLGAACSWNPALLQASARVAAAEASAVGIDWTFAPMVDIARDPRWGRIAEGSGEDVYLTSQLAAAQVRGFQAEDLPSGRRVVACPKHFVAYGAAEAGRDYNTVDISERTLRDVYLPPFQAALKAGAGTIMTAFNELSGVPATMNEFILRDVLRGEWGWQGVVVSDYESVSELLNHGSVRDLQDAAEQCLRAGLDIEMVSAAYHTHLTELIKQGAVDVGLLDEAVRRVLRLKFRLGLFEQPYVDEAKVQSAMLQPEALKTALQLAQQSIVLLKNDQNVLPLRAGQKIAVIGPLANHRRTLLGCWTIFGREDETKSILEALQAVQDVSFAEGCSVRGNEPQDFSAALAVAQGADVVLLVLGEDHDLSGEARSRTRLGLPGQQQALADAIFDTGKPVVTVILSGRPLVVPELAQRSAALLAAWHGGTQAGQALADILFGRVNPSGKLAASWPRSVGQLPMTYAHKNTGRPFDSAGVTQFGEPFKSRYVDEDNSPLFPFGYGLSYAAFEYSALQVTPTLPLSGTLQISVQVKNTSSHSGTEVVQVYVRDLMGSVTRPVRELKRFARVDLQAGEAKEVKFQLPAAQLAFCGKDGRVAAEAGEFQLFVGGDSQASLSTSFTLTA